MLIMAVYGICILIGSVIGCIAGIPGVNGYAGQLLQTYRRKKEANLQSSSLAELSWVWVSQPTS